MMRSLSALRRSRSGVSAVEFALIAVPALILIFGSIQNAMLALARISLDIAVQNFAHDLANASLSDLPAQAERKTLCQKPALYLVDCETSPDFCLSIAPLDVSGKNGGPASACETNVAQFQPAQCCYAIVVEYPVPLAFDLVRLMGLNAGASGSPLILRSSALVYRA